MFRFALNKFNFQMEIINKYWWWHILDFKFREV
jgi:hypothetical protein